MRMELYQSYWEYDLPIRRHYKNASEGAGEPRRHFLRSLILELTRWKVAGKFCIS